MLSDSIPACVRARGDRALAAYHRAIETGGSTYDKRVKVLIVGQDRVGKTSLSKALRGEPFHEAELSTEGVQMIPAIKNAGTGAWRNPSFLKHTTVFDHKVAAKTAEDLLSKRSEQPAKKRPRIEASNKTDQLFVQDGKRPKNFLLRWLNTVLAVCEYTSFAKSWQEKGCSSHTETWQVKNILMKDFD